MASWAHAMHMIRRARREQIEPPTTEFVDFKSDYRVILEEVRACGGDRAIDSLTDWIVASTHDHGRLPEPDAVRARAKAICDAQGVSIPDGSPLEE